MARQRLASRPQTTGYRKFEQYKDDPISFTTEVLGVKLWPRQEEILRAALIEGRIAVRSGHKVGKSLIAACIALWFACTRPLARVILTAPTHRQIRAILWREIKRLYHNALKPLGGELHELPEIGLQWEDGREVVGFYTTEPEKMAGISGQNVLFLVDEASGIPSEIYEAIEGNRAGGAKLIMFSNPTQTSGTFFNAFHTKRAYWHCIHISSEEAALTGIPGLATREFIREKRGEWGEGSILFQVRIKGNFPTQQSDAVIALVDAEAAVERYDDTHDDAPLQLGVDPARFGDDRSIIIARRGLKAFPAVVVIGLDTHQVGARAVEVVRRLRRSVHERPHVKVDVTGLGAGVVDYLREYARQKEITLAELNASAKPRDERKYHDIRAELWFRCSAWLKSGGAIPPDDELLSELTTPTYDFDLKNRLRVMEKDEIKKLIDRSPDKADALCLAVYDAPSARFAASTVKSRYG